MMKHPWPAVTSTLQFTLFWTGERHRICTGCYDELWYFHDGSSIVVHCFYPDGTYEAVHLGRNIERGEQLQFRVPAGTIFGSEVLDASSFGLVSCAVAPGFDYHDFELFTQEQLLAEYPEQAEVIRRVAYQKLPAE